MIEHPIRLRRIVTAAIIAGVSQIPHNAVAQQAATLDLGGRVEVGGELERYLRVLQLSGIVAPTSWTMQPFAPAGERLLRPTSVHPWQARFPTADTTSLVRWLRPQVKLVENTAFPFQDPVGPAWEGKGGTLVLQAGAALRWNRLSLQLAPVVFRAQNLDFPLAANGQSGILQYGDARLPTHLDHPQRFGNAAYGRLDPGTSSVSVELPYLTFGASSAPQRWGPAREYPLILGPEAGGFPHGFLATNRPIDLKFARVQARLIAGPLVNSDYAAVPATDARRFASGGIVTAAFPWLDGAEVGAVRFFDVTGGATAFRILRPFSLKGLVGAQGDTIVDNIHGENQIASVFFRWIFPDAGFELYGEWYREDYPGDLRKLILKPDDLSTLEFGLQRVLRASAAGHRVFRFEMVNGELSHQERGQRGINEPIPPYTHFEVTQGHTEHGRVLGSETAFGGAGWRIGLDDFTPRGRRSMTVERWLRAAYSPVPPPPGTVVDPDVVYAIRLELMQFSGKRDYTFTVAPALDLNRNLISRNDRFNVHASVAVGGW